MNEQSSAKGDVSSAAEAETRNRAEAHARAQFAARRAYKRARRRAYNPYYLSWRSLFFLVCIVIAAALAVVVALAAMRGAPDMPPSAPVIEVIAAPARSAAEAESGRTSESASAEEEVILAAETPDRLGLAGPPVPTVIITNTPVPLTVGVRAAVANVGRDELNVRNIPSVRESQVLFRAAEGTVFAIIGGPQQADGYTWWQLYDPAFEVRGWAVANYLQSVEEGRGE